MVKCSHGKTMIYNIPPLMSGGFFMLFQSDNI